MRTRSLVALLGAVVAAACVPGGPIYVGPPIVTLEGNVVAFENRTPLPQTEVCVFGSDTLCIAADKNGHYRAAFEPTLLLEGGVIDVRFRKAGYATAMLHLTGITTGTYKDTHCAISSRVTLSRDPIACLPIQE